MHIIIKIFFCYHICLDRHVKFLCFIFRRDDLFSSIATRPSVLRTGYVRPWTNTTLQKNDSGSTINVKDDKFEVILDVAQFEPSEITVKTTDKFIIVEGKHEEKQDEHGMLYDFIVLKENLYLNVFF